MLDSDKASLPDVSHPQPELNWGAKLPWVGMREIEIPVQVGNLRLAARLDIGVSLQRSDARGIHMSRLYRLASESLPGVDLSFESLQKLGREALQTHQGLSDQLQLKLRFQLPLQREALKSGGQGWRTYPIELSLTSRERREDVCELQIEVLYSSTCPASAALSRQLNQRASLEHFGGPVIERQELAEWLSSPQSLAATPHAQRSRAQVRVQLAPEAREKSLMDLCLALIERVEEGLGTPVQTLVKREDEQEFAARNAQHLMFCEDAARILYEVLEDEGDYLAWSGEVAHFESLHPHDAVAEFSGSRF